MAGRRRRRRTAPAHRRRRSAPAPRGASPCRSSPTSRRRRCRSTSSRRCRRPATCGRPATGPGTTTNTTGCRAPGSQPPRAGLLWTPGYWGFVDGRLCCSIAAIGARMSASTAASPTASAITAAASRAAAGTAIVSSTTAPSTISGRVNIVNVYEHPAPQIVRARQLQRRPRGQCGRGRRPQELAAAKETHVPPTAAQRHNVSAASRNGIRVRLQQQGQAAGRRDRQARRIQGRRRRAGKGGGRPVSRSSRRGARP